MNGFHLRLQMVIITYYHFPCRLSKGDWRLRLDISTDSIVRCPCPFTNTLANHGYIPRNGLNVSGDVVLAVFDEVFNIDQSFTIGPVTNALSVSTTGINGTFNLPDVNIHNCMPIHPCPLINN